MKKKITFSKSGARSAKRAEARCISQALRMLFATTQAVYDSGGNRYSLNGLSDISEEEMIEIYSRKEAIDGLDLWQVLRNGSIRTIVPCEKEVGLRLKNRPLKGYYSFADSLLEVLKFSHRQTLDTTDVKELLPVESLNGTFCQCRCLHTVYPMDVSAVESIGYETFKGCTALKELRLYGLRSSLNLSMVPLLTYASLLYIVSNAGDTTGINITLNPATYKYLTGLEVPGSYIGGTSEEWQVLHRNARLKGFTFGTSGTVAYVKENTLHIDRGVYDKNILTINDTSSCSISDKALVLC